ncbi:MAG: Smr/MutS family protein, partial [Myxococcota bacterium]
VQVRIGGLTVRCRPEELQAPAASRSVAKSYGGQRSGEASRETSRGSSPKPSKEPGIDDAVRVPGNTLDMRGMRVEEGQDAAERFFDLAVRGGWDRVFLLHGHGTGALKDGLRAWLSSSAYVSAWAPASEEQGGDAFTVVVLGAGTA